MNNFKFKTGEFIEVIHDGYQYNSYEELAIKLKATKWKNEKWNKCTLYDGQVGIVINRNKHPGQRSLKIYLIRVNNQEYLIEETGLKSVPKLKGLLLS